MLTRYLSAAAIGVLISAWLASAAYAFFYVRRANALAVGVGRDTATYEEIFSEANEVRLGELRFPRSRVFTTVREAWTDTTRPRPYPNGLISPPTVPTPVTRPGAAPARPRRSLGPRR
jgi:hypothetical protein